MDLLGWRDYNFGAASSSDVMPWASRNWSARV